MDILVFASRDIRHPKFAGGDVYNFEVLRLMAKHGHNVSMVTSSYPGAGRHEIVDGISVFRIRASNRFSRMLRNYLVYRKQFAGKADIVIEEAEGPQGPFFLRLFVKEPIVLMWFQLGRKIFLGQYGPVLGRALSLLDYVYAGLYRRNLIVVLSSETEREISRLARSSRVLIVRPGLPDNSTLPVRVPSRGASRRCDGLFLLTINKIRRYKSLDHAIRAFGLIAHDFPDLKLVIGGIREDEKYENELAELGGRLAPGRVIILPDLSRSEKEALLAGAYAFVMPSPIEGFSLATLEALAVGTPAVVSDGVPDDLVIDGYNGLKYPYGELAKLAECYRLLLTNPDVRARMSLAAKTTAQKFDWETGAGELVTAMEQMVASSRRNETQVPGRGLSSGTA
jgi:glycosyltransferase involved in cell wall biosynthesis